MSIIGKTNGAASSEFKLAKIALTLITGATALMVASGWLTPEMAEQWNAAGAAMIDNIKWIVGLYALGRSGVKVATIIKGDKPEAIT